MVEFSKDDINQLERIYRINLINSCSGYKSANLIGTKSQDKISNVAVFSSVTHIGSDPALLGFFMRPTKGKRNTYDNIKTSSCFTINPIFETILEAAHHTSAKYDGKISEFNVTDLEEEYKADFFAPFVKGAPLQLAMEFMEEYPIKANGTTLVIGAIKKIYVPDNLIETDGFINLAKAKVATINGADAYSIPELKTRLDYQRPKAEFKNMETS